MLEGLTNEKSLTSSLSLLNELTFAQMHALIIEEFRQNKESKNIVPFMKRIDTLINV